MVVYIRLNSDNIGSEHAIGGADVLDFVSFAGEGKIDEGMKFCGTVARKLYVVLAVLHCILYECAYMTRLLVRLLRDDWTQVVQLVHCVCLV